MRESLGMCSGSCCRQLCHGGVLHASCACHVPQTPRLSCQGGTCKARVVARRSINPMAARKLPRMRQIRRPQLGSSWQAGSDAASWEAHLCLQ